MTYQSLLGPDILRTVHLVGIGGAGMSGVARMLLSLGSEVSGSDTSDSAVLDALDDLGATIYRSHHPDHIGSAGAVVYSSAIDAQNPELLEARRRGLPVLHRAQALAALLSDHRTVAVAGTNGKTTTTAMIVASLRSAGQDPSFVVGGELLDGDTNAYAGTGDLFVLEADESDRTFLLYEPEIAVVTNVEADHLDTYGTVSAVEAAFTEFAGGIRPGGLLIACADDPGARRLAVKAAATGVQVRTYGEAADSDLRIIGLMSTPDGARFTASHEGHPVMTVQLPIHGRHMALNAAAALLVALELGVEPASAITGLSSYGGVRRRCESRGDVNGIRLFDDYAYHPTSVTAQLNAVRSFAGTGRVLTVFQPYRFNRTTTFRAGLATALALSDEVVVMEVFGPGEQWEADEGGAALCAAIELPDHQKTFVRSWAEVPVEVAVRARPGDVVVTMGAPPIAAMADDIVAAIAQVEARLAT